MSIVVLPRIEQENPFGVLAQTISEEVLPYVIALYTNKDKIARLSDTELTDFVEVLQRHAPELAKDGKIDWEKVNEWAKSDEKLKQNVANFLLEAKKVREEFANSPLLVKLQTLDMVGALNNQELNKIFTVEKSIKKFVEIVEKSDLPTIWKVVLLENAEKFADRPDLIKKLSRVLGVEKEETAQSTKQETNTTSEDLKTSSEEPQLNLNSQSPYNIEKSPHNIESSQNNKKGTRNRGAVFSPQKTPPQPQSLLQITPFSQSQHLSQPQNTQNQTTSQDRSLDTNKLLTNKDLLLTGGSALATLLVLAATRNPKMAIQTPLLLASLKEAGKNVGRKTVSAIKAIPEKVKQATNTLAQSGIVGKVEPPLPKQNYITTVINPPKPPSIENLIKQVNKTNIKKQQKARKGRKSKQ